MTDACQTASPDHDPAVATMILNHAHAWPNDPQGALMALPLDRPEFDAAFLEATPHLHEILGDQTPRFVREVYDAACTRHDPGPRRDTMRRTDIVLVPFIATAGDLASVTGDDYETVLGFSEAFDRSGYGGDTDFTLFFPRPMRPEWIAGLQPGGLRKILTNLARSLHASEDQPDFRVSLDREALAHSIDPEGSQPDIGGGHCVRALLGLHMRANPIEAERERVGQARRFVAMLAESHPTLLCGPPAGALETYGRMRAMDIAVRWVAEAKMHGLTLPVRPIRPFGPPQGDRISRILVHEDGQGVHFIAEVSGIPLGPVTIQPDIWPVIAPEIIPMMQVYAPLVRHDDRAFADLRERAN